MASGVDEGLKTVQDFTLLEAYCAQLDDGIGVGVEAGGFQVDANELLLKGVDAGPAEDGWLGHRHRWPPVGYALRSW